MDATLRERARRDEILEILIDEFPGSTRDLCELRFDDAFQLTIATVLSAQCTDVMVNAVTPGLFERFPDAASLGVARVEEVEDLIHSIGLFRTKSRNIVAISRLLTERYNGVVPVEMEKLVALPGIGRKTANVVRSVGFGLPGLAVDTHVARVSKRLGLTTSTDPIAIEKDLCVWLEPEERGGFSLRLILHGRRVCSARSPRCEICPLSHLCPSMGSTGSVKPARSSGPSGRR